MTAEPMEVRRVPTDSGGSRIEPALDESWSELDQLRWHAAVVGLDADLEPVAVEVNTPGGRRQPATYTLYSAGQSSGPHTAAELHGGLSVLERAARLAPHLSSELVAVRRERDEALAALDTWQDAMGNAGRIWRAPNGTLIVQVRGDETDPAEFLPEGARELVEAP